MVDILEFPGISHNSDYHIGGVGVDQESGLLSIVVDAADAFITGGADVLAQIGLCNGTPSPKLFSTN